MAFNSYQFILFFLPVYLLIHYLLTKLEKYVAAKYFLLFANFVFYSWMNIKSIYLLVFSIIFNYYIGIFLQKNQHMKGKKLLFILFLIINLVPLFLFKYYNFFIDNMNFLMQTDFNLIHIALPLGISFFTFQQIAYIADAYMGKLHQYSFLDYAIFVSYFPKILQGPIALHDEIIPKLSNLKHGFQFESFNKGFYGFSLGLAKKVLIADTLGKVVSWGFGVASLTFFDAIAVMLCYSLQIYFDFSGYCDMANGISRMLNIQLPMNFNSPYKSLDIIEFWKRWHMTLTRFFTKYIYIPLGGNRKGTFHTYLNTMIIFIISGFWHGANWTFVLWGGIHGIAMILNKIFKHQFNRLHPIFRWMITFLFVNIAWIIFRSDNLSQAFSIIESLLTFQFQIPSFIYSLNLVEIELICKLLNLDILIKIFPFIFIGATLLSVIFMRNTDDKLKTFNASMTTAFLSSILIVWSLTSLMDVTTFLYVGF